jgi:hypothetical protein
LKLYDVKIFLKIYLCNFEDVMKLFPYYKKQSIELNSFDMIQVQIHQSIIRVNI